MLYFNGVKFSGMFEFTAMLSRNINVFATYISVRILCVCAHVCLCVCIHLMQKRTVVRLQ